MAKRGDDKRPAIGEPAQHATVGPYLGARDEGAPLRLSNTYMLGLPWPLAAHCGAMATEDTVRGVESQLSSRSHSRERRRSGEEAEAH